MQVKMLAGQDEEAGGFGSGQYLRPDIAAGDAILCNLVYRKNRSCGCMLRRKTDRVGREARRPFCPFACGVLLNKS